MDLKQGFIAGFAATVVLSALMIAKSMMGLMPELDVIAMLAEMTGTGSSAVGWIAHFVIGTLLWGGLYAAMADRLPGGPGVQSGVIFATGAWALMMIVVMPMAGAGFFGLALGIMAPVMTLVLHLIFGIVLGSVFVAQPRHTAA